MLNDTQKEVLVFLITSLRDSGVEFQATGGLAAIAHGAKRSLYDIDIDIYKRDVETVRSLFKDYIVEDWNNELEGPDSEFDVWMMTLNIKGVSVDISQAEGLRIKSKGGEWRQQPETMEYEMGVVEGISLPIQTKNSLIAYKQILARDTDLIDIEQIS